MQRLKKILAVLVAAAAVSSPALAHADGFISPFLGANFGNNSGNGRMSTGANAGWMGAGVIGAELDFGYAPSFFGNKGTFGSNSVTDVMGNVIVGVPAGGTHGAGVRPYVSLGAGLLRSRLNGVAGGTGAYTNNEAGMNAAVGVMGYMSNHLGLRGDVRYFRNLSDTSTTNSANIDFGSFHFWRASVGIVLRP